MAPDIDIFIKICHCQQISLSLIHQCHYFMTPCGGMTVGKVNGNRLAEEKVDSGIMMDHGEKNLNLSDE